MCLCTLADRDGWLKTLRKVRVESRFRLGEGTHAANVQASSELVGTTRWNHATTAPRGRRCCSRTGEGGIAAPCARSMLSRSTAAITSPGRSAQAGGVGRHLAV